MEPKIYQGIGVGNNSAWGRAFVLSKPKFTAETKSSLDPATELNRLKDASAVVSQQFDQSTSAIDSVSSEIIKALQSMVQDPALVIEAEKHIGDGWDAETSIQKAMTSFTEALRGVPTFEDRVADLEDIALRVVAVLTNQTWTFELPKVGPVVIVAEDLSPLETSQFTDAVVAVITSGGGPTSHTAIICRQKNIPALVAVGGALEIGNNAGVFVDAFEGIAKFSENPITSETKQIRRQRTGPSLVSIKGNIGSIQDAEVLAKTEASGVGLMRTELLFLSRTSAPSISEQTDIYSSILKSSPKGEFIFRTFDSANDKPLAFYDNNPSEVLEEQLQAIADAQDLSRRKVSVMAPMLSTFQEVEDFVLLARTKGIARVGVMVETVALTEVIAELASIVDFVSIGTNDLSRDLFKVDREDSSSASLLDPWQPELLRAIKGIADEASNSAIEVGVCGEAASDPLLGIVLAGLGVQSLSMAAPAVSESVDYLSSVSLEQAQVIAASALQGNTALEAKELALAALPH